MQQTARIARPRVGAPQAETTGIDWIRVRFAACVTIFGGTMGAAAVLVNTVARIEYPEIIQRLTLWDSLLFGSAGLLGSILVAAPAAYWLFGSMPVFLIKRKRNPRGFRRWIVLGIMFGLFFPFVTGAVFIPVGLNLLDFFTGLLTIPDILAKSLDLVLFAPSVGLLLGIRILFTGMMAGILFAPGGWIIDRFNLSDDPTTAKYGTWAITLVMSVGVSLAVSLAPIDLLSKLG